MEKWKVKKNNIRNHQQLVKHPKYRENICLKAQ